MRRNPNPGQTKSFAGHPVSNVVLWRNLYVDEMRTPPSKVEGAGHSGSVEVNGLAEVPNEAGGLQFLFRTPSVEQSSCGASMQAGSLVSLSLLLNALLGFDPVPMKSLGTLNRVYQ